MLNSNTSKEHIKIHYKPTFFVEFTCDTCFLNLFDTLFRVCPINPQGVSYLSAPCPNGPQGGAELVTGDELVPLP